LTCGVGCCVVGAWDEEYLGGSLDMTDEELEAFEGTVIQEKTDPVDTVVEEINCVVAGGNK